MMDDDESNEYEFEDIWEEDWLLEMTNILKEIDKRNRSENVVDSLTYRNYMSRINFFNGKFRNSEEVPSCEYNGANSLENNGILFIYHKLTH